MIDRLSFLGIKDISEQKTATISTGTSEDFLIQPPLGQIYQVVLLGFSNPAIAAGGDGGTHQIQMQYVGTAFSGTADQSFLYKSNYDSDIVVRNTGYVQTADSNQSPPNADEQINILKTMIGNNTVYPKVTYANNATTQDQTNARDYICIVKVYNEVL